MRLVQLIISADDFGASKAVNDAVIDAFRRGILTSCSIMASGEAFLDAVGRARECPDLGVGLHLVAVHGRSVLPHREIPMLVDPLGRFLDDPTLAGLRYYFSRKARRELRRELAAQFEKALGASIPLSHIDGHLHLHVHPVIFRLAVDLGKQYGVCRMRVPEDDLSLARRFDPDLDRGRVVEAAVFRFLTRRMKKRLREEGFSFPSRVFGHLMTGRMDEDYLLFLLDNLPHSASEVYLHPAVYPDPGRFGSSGYRGRTEYDALMSLKVRRRLEELGLRRVRYSDLACTVGPPPAR